MAKVLRTAILGLWALAPMLGWGQSGPYPFFPPPGITYNQTNGNLTLQNLTLTNLTGILIGNNSALVTVYSGTTCTNQFVSALSSLAAATCTSVNLAAGSPLVINTLPVSNGGSGVATLTAHGLLLGEGTSNVSAVAAMAADTLLQGQGASADPAAVPINNCGSSTQALSYSTSTHTFGCQTISTGGTVPVTSGGTGLTTLTAHGVLLGEGTANVGAVAAMAADTLLQGQGTGADPSAIAVNNCGSTTQALSYSTSTHTFGCQSITTGSSTLTATFVGYGNGSNVLTGTSDFTWVDSTRTLLLGGTAGATVITTGPEDNASAGGLSIFPGANTFFGTGGALTLHGSNATGAAIGGGNAVLAGGTSASSTAGSVILQTNGNTRITLSPSGNTSFTGAINSAGTKFTATGCSNSATVGGAIAGQYTSGTTGTCAVAITLPASANGWACQGSDLTTSANLISQTATTTSSCTLSGTTVSGDVIVFSALGY